MKYSLQLGNISGIRISVHWTFLILIVWVVYRSIRSGATGIEVAWSVGYVLTIFFCVVLHELGHAFAAKRYNIKTRDITLLPIGGIARLESIPEKPKEELVVAIAGPLVNIAIVALLFPFVSLFFDLAEIQTLEHIGPANFLPLVMTINLWLALFNLIPAFPMDGGRILRALLGFRLDHAHATRIAASIGQLLAIAFVFFGFMYQPMLIFIGLFIFLGAQAEAAHSQHKLLLKGFFVRDVVMHEIPTMDEGMTVAEAASRLLDSQNRNFLVVRNGQPVGTLSRDNIIRALGEQGDRVTLTGIKDGDLMRFPASMPLEQAWTRLQNEKKPLALVEENNELLGVVDYENMAEFVLIRTARSNQDPPITSEQAV
jgi:Zn-dependent protease/CBS domain-containing protein